EGLAAQTGGAADGYTVTTCAELRRKWPDPRWRLAVNAGSPIDAYLPIDAVEAAAVGDVAIPTAAEVAAEGEGGLEVDGYVRSLLDAVVLVPTTRAVDDPNEILDPGFPWLVTGSPQEPVIELFTAEELLTRAYPGPVPSIAAALPVVLSMWPQGHDLSLDPRTPQQLDLPADHVQMLLLWADEGDSDGEESAP
ncbi:MAG TPA: SseB family protein, partial [Pilimelia sp.]|nr:SseB family protein [Pilimelia sp.]